MSKDHTNVNNIVRMLQCYYSTLAKDDWVEIPQGEDIAAQTFKIATVFKSPALSLTGIWIYTF